MKKNQYGFSIVEILIVVVVIGLVVVAGWYVSSGQSDTNAPQSKTTSTKLAAETTPEQYKRTTTVPSDWKKYTNEAYKISLAYPPDWAVDDHVFTKNAGEVVQNSFSKNATEILTICYKPKGLIQVCANQIDINNQSLAESLKEIRTYYRDSIPSITTERKISFDGHEGVEFSGKDEKVYFISANDKTYMFSVTLKEQSNGEGIEPLTPEDSLIMFESIKID